MKNLFKNGMLWCLALVTLFAASCEKDNSASTEDVIPTPKNFVYGEEDIMQFTFDADDKWSLSSSETWVSFEIDGVESDNPVGTASSESVTVELLVSVFETEVDATADITLTVGTTETVVATVTLSRNIGDDLLKITYAVGGEEFTEATIEWNGTNAFVLPVDIYAPFAWEIDTKSTPEWMDTESMALAGDAYKTTRLLLTVDMAEYPQTPEEDGYDFTVKHASKDVSKSVTLNLEDVTKEFYLVDGLSITSGVDFDSETGFISGDTDSLTTFSFTVMVYGETSPKAFYPDITFDGSDIVFAELNQWQNSGNSWDFAVEAATPAPKKTGNFTRYTFEIEADGDASANASAGLFVMPASTGVTSVSAFNSYYDSYLGESGYVLTPSEHSYYLGELSTDGGVTALGAFTLQSSYAAMMGISLLAISEEHDSYEYYTKTLGVAEENISVMTLSCSGATMAGLKPINGFDYAKTEVIVPVDPGEPSQNYYVAADGTAVTTSKWMNVNVSGEGVALFENSSLSDYLTDQTAFPLHGFVEFRETPGSEKPDFILHVTVTE